jgi:lactoylglutathione lyase
VIGRRIGTRMKIEHIALYVQDLEGAKNFFITYFHGKGNEGYYNINTGFRSYFITFEDGARLEIMNKPEMVDAPKSYVRTGHAHIAFGVGSREKVDELTRKLQQDGYDIISGPRVTGDGYYESCIVGFEGNLIEITL